MPKTQKMEGPRELTIVSATDRGLRVSVPMIRCDERFVWVALLGAELRFSRRSGFELPEGGSWGKWRLSGKDMRRLKL